jgi:tRNA (guanine-N7-)-methyltransferase
MSDSREDGADTARPSLKSFARCASRMSRAQERSYETLFPRFARPYSPEIIDLGVLFGNDLPLICEIGFGMGSATAALAEAQPGINYLGIEVYRAGIGRLLWEIEQRGLSNVRIIEGDAVLVFEKMIPRAVFDGIHLFFPDPWPKKRHHKRRLVRRPFTFALAGSLRAGGYLHFVSDWLPYAVSARAELSATPSLALPPPSAAAPAPGRPSTAFERKGRAHGREIHELFFVKHEL